MNASLCDAWVNIQNVDANKVYAISCCIAYWLDFMGYGDDLKKNFKSLLVSYPQVDPAAMGFPKDWNSEPLWRLEKKKKKQEGMLDVAYFTSDRLSYMTFSILLQKTS